MFLLISLDQLAFSEWHKWLANNDVEALAKTPDLSDAIPGIDLIIKAAFANNEFVVDNWCKHHEFKEANVHKVFFSSFFPPSQMLII